MDVVLLLLQQQILDLLTDIGNLVQLFRYLQEIVQIILDLLYLMSLDLIKLGTILEISMARFQIWVGARVDTIFIEGLSVFQLFFILSKVLTLGLP